MKILDVKTLAFPEIKVVRFGRFRDGRGVFTEKYRKSDLSGHRDLDCFRGIEFVQGNESCSAPGVARGLHLQWNPYQGKLVRTVWGRMVDLVLDIRSGSPTFGKIIAYDMPSSLDEDYSEWIWVPPGFAHGNFFPERTMIEYLCSGEYNPACEAGIAPLAPDIDWSLCDESLKALLDDMVRKGLIMTDRDRCGLTLESWGSDEGSRNFVYGHPS
jgi:dTDP-4-dehydrorhamnose 3,5-epimerase